jgi:hypothetical protein
LATPLRSPPSPLARAARAALALLACLAAGADASAQVMVRRPLALYPVAAGTVTADATDVQGLLEVALRRVAQRSEDVVVAEPPLLRGACGPAPSASLPCLAQLAGPGLVLRSTVHRSYETLLVAIEAVDAAGRAYGPVSASVDSFVQSAEPLAQAVRLLVEQVLAAERRRAASPRPPATPAPDAGAQAQASPAATPSTPGATSPTPGGAPAPTYAGGDVPLPPPPDLRAPAPKPGAVPVAPPKRPARAWMGTAGPWLSAAGAALLAGGVGLAVVNRSLSDELDRKYAAGTLTPSDAASYDRVERYNQLTAILLASGGGITLTGVALWTAAPEPGRVVGGVAGRF